MNKNIISISRFALDGYKFIMQDNNCTIRKGEIFYGNVLLENGLYVLDLNNYKSIYNINTERIVSNVDNQTYFWHCRLGHINEKCISKLHTNGLLDSFDMRSYETCESCLLGKMTKKPFSNVGERSSDLLELIHTDVCGPMSMEARGGYRYFITFTDDYSRYGFIYLMRQKSDSFESHLI